MERIFDVKITILEKVPRNKIGRLNKNGVKLEPAEEETSEYLLLYGFNIEVIVPTNLNGVSNPDILISGGIWEIKTPTSCNEQTIKNRFREAASQSSRVVFDLRFVKKNAKKVEKQVIKLYKNDRIVRRLMLIDKSGAVFDMVK